MAGKHEPPQLPARLSVVRDMSDHVLDSLCVSARQYNASRAEVLGALLTAALRVIKVIVRESTGPEMEFANRAEMVKSIERLWMIAAGEGHESKGQPF